MISIMKVDDTEVGWIWMKSSFNEFFGMRPRIWVIDDDILWL